MQDPSFCINEARRLSVVSLFSNHSDVAGDSDDQDGDDNKQEEQQLLDQHERNAHYASTESGTFIIPNPMVLVQCVVGRFVKFKGRQTLSLPCSPCLLHTYTPALITALDSFPFKFMLVAFLASSIIVSGRRNWV
jgi:hypothetical protein